jgi:hypothetical protein
MFTRSKVAAIPQITDAKSPPRSSIMASTMKSTMMSPKPMHATYSEDMDAMKKEMKKIKMLVNVMQQSVTDLVAEVQSEKQKNSKLQQENDDLRYELKAKEARLVKVEQFCEQAGSLGPYISTKFSKAEQTLSSMIDSKIAEHVGDKEAITKLDHKVNVLQSQVNGFEASLCKDLNVEGELASIKDDIRGHVGEFENIRRRFERSEEATREVQAKLSTPYRDVVTRSVGSVSPSAATPGHTMNAAPKDLHAMKCVIRAPKGMFQGRSSAVRAQAFNTKVIANLALKGGHFSRPEAVNMDRLGGKEGAAHERWVLRFNSASDVSKLFEYKKQLKDICPQAFVEPYLTKEEIGYRNLIWVGAKQFMNQQAVPNAWRFQWIENVKGLITGPAGARRYVVMDGESAKVTDGGNVRFVGAKERNVAAERSE